MCLCIRACACVYGIWVTHLTIIFCVSVYTCVCVCLWYLSHAIDYNFLCVCVYVCVRVCACTGVYGIWVTHLTIIWVLTDSSYFLILYSTQDDSIAGVKELHRALIYTYICLALRQINNLSYDLKKWLFGAFINLYERFLRPCRAFPRSPRVAIPLDEVWLKSLFLNFIWLWRHSGGRLWLDKWLTSQGKILFRVRTLISQI